ncbi:peptide deformylase [Toxoplasma gondii TgCatPRC2]|uniref:Peptide deformylase n=9 Tax=Toxoplasma gondii TaxID=5811 RepID=A0A125YFA5_TOXGV|nr:hypothetical protein TGME49_216700 [Toxoplasma gondii ME49]ESS28681.1 peptide deformylase [Toxoplasma gondii VEG]KFG32460.1 peptide deformylase [Toxoplasma gondii GAB2-2007-GAL-DOM2]KFG41151.1 peptide deformylase [Toxoplasma gondii FOU]KYF38781.1 peptide deformylase [Toxoplasma gondii ARI]KYK64430.1 peptide deformylase [Toxoplasma gondii TgCatPRC2]PUA83918.1 peptide deformylase [Toxoplasma gondii TgCATBr9]|eukprot:XP_002370978.2 hypothetical protein TGME49_216700 [Toxoplasma gondii ME49]
MSARVWKSSATGDSQEPPRERETPESRSLRFLGLVPIFISFGFFGTSFSPDFHLCQTYILDFFRIFSDFLSFGLSLFWILTFFCADMNAVRPSFAVLQLCLAFGLSAQVFPSACLSVRGDFKGRLLLEQNAPSVQSHSSLLSPFPLAFVSPSSFTPPRRVPSISASSPSSSSSSSPSFFSPFPSSYPFFSSSSSSSVSSLSASPWFSSSAASSASALHRFRSWSASGALPAFFRGDEKERRGREERGKQRREAASSNSSFQPREASRDVTLDVLAAPHTLLRLPAHPEADWQAKETKELAKDLLAVMYRDGGVGLAAPQVGVSVQMIVWNPTGDVRESSRERVFLNPRLLSLYGPLVSDVEGCLSVPGVFAPVERPLHARVRYTSLEGIQREATLSGLEARVVQHEIDHLHGILFVDRVHRGERSAHTAFTFAGGEKTM